MKTFSPTAQLCCMPLAHVQLCNNYEGRTLQLLACNLYDQVI